MNPSDDGTSTFDIDDKSNFQSLSDLLQVNPTMKIPSSSIDDESVTKQMPNVESFGSTSDPNMGLKQLLPPDLIIKGGIEKLRKPYHLQLTQINRQKQVAKLKVPYSMQ